jgi:hypothetical protein
MSDVTTTPRVSKITVPARANPFVKLVFHEMQRQGVTYADLEWTSGVLISTFKAWRKENRPGLETLEAALGALGWVFVPVPRIERLPKDVQEGLETLAAKWHRDEPLLHQFLAHCCRAPEILPERAAERARNPSPPGSRKTVAPAMELAA